MTEEIDNGLNRKPISQEKAAQMYIQAVRSFINWRRAKFRVNRNNDNRS